MWALLFFTGSWICCLLCVFCVCFLPVYLLVWLVGWLVGERKRCFAVAERFVWFSGWLVGWLVWLFGWLVGLVVGGVRVVAEHKTGSATLITGVCFQLQKYTGKRSKNRDCENTNTLVL